MMDKDYITFIEFTEASNVVDKEFEYDALKCNKNSSELLLRMPEKDFVSFLMESEKFKMYFDSFLANRMRFFSNFKKFYRKSTTLSEVDNLFSMLISRILSVDGEDGKRLVERFFDFETLCSIGVLFPQTEGNSFGKMLYPRIVDSLGSERLNELVQAGVRKTISVIDESFCNNKRKGFERAKTVSKSLKFIEETLSVFAEVSASIFFLLYNFGSELDEKSLEAMEDFVLSSGAHFYNFFDLGAFFNKHKRAVASADQYTIAYLEYLSSDIVDYYLINTTIHLLKANPDGKLAPSMMADPSHYTTLLRDLCIEYSSEFPNVFSDIYKDIMEIAQKEVQIREKMQSVKETIDKRKEYESPSLSEIRGMLMEHEMNPELVVEEILKSQEKSKKPANDTRTSKRGRKGRKRGKKGKAKKEPAQRKLVQRKGKEHYIVLKNTLMRESKDVDVTIVTQRSLWNQGYSDDDESSY